MFKEFAENMAYVQIIAGAIGAIITLINFIRKNPIWVICAAITVAVVVFIGTCATSKAKNAPQTTKTTASQKKDPESLKELFDEYHFKGSEISRLTENNFYKNHETKKEC